MSDTEGLNTIKTVLSYVEQQDTTPDNLVAEVSMEHSSKEVSNCN
jgi:hypothetical protein